MQQTDTTRIRKALSDPDLARILSTFRERWVRYGRTAGQVKLESWAEVHAISGLTGLLLQPGSTLKAQTFEEALRDRAGFACDLRYALGVHFGDPIVTSEEQRDAQRLAWEDTRHALQDLLDQAPLAHEVKARLTGWLEAEAKHFRRSHTQDRDGLLRDFESVTRALGHLPRTDEVIALAVLATHALGNPHGLDAGTPVAKLFDRALARLHPEVASILACGAEGRDELLAAAGIARDRTSPKVDTIGLVSPDPTLAWLADYPLMTFTLRSLEALRGRGLHAARGIAFVVENPSVFDQIAERLLHAPPDKRPTVICTNGWLNLADRLLLRELVQNGDRLRYSGDFDGNGLAIAASVIDSFAPAADLWRMMPEDYRAALGPSGPPLDREAFSAGSRVAPELADEMHRHGRAAYQEAILDRLLEDLCG